MKETWTRLMFRLALRLNKRKLSKRARLERKFLAIDYQVRQAHGILNEVLRELKSLESDLLGENRILH